MVCSLQRPFLQNLFRPHISVRFESTERVVTLIPGDGIGPEISAAVQKIFSAAEVLLLVCKYRFKTELNHRKGSDNLGESRRDSS